MTYMKKDVPVHYQEFGQGKAILCLHGFGIDHHVMSGCLEPIFTDINNYRRIYMDLPGMGKTPGAPWIKGSDEVLE